SMPGQRGGTAGQTQQQNQTGQRSGTGNQPTTQPSPNQPSNNTTNNTNNPANTAPVFISGNVLLSDGTRPPINTQVHVVCDTRNLKTEYVDPSGNFSMILTVEGSTFNLNSLFGCEVRASLPGYLSNDIPLDRQSSLDNSDVGTL